LYYGCGGNANRFNTPNDCNNICKPTSVIINGPPIGSGVQPGNGNNINQPPIGGGAQPGNGNNNNQPPIGSGTNNGNPQIGQGAMPRFMQQNVMNAGQPRQAQMNIGQGTGPQNPMNVGQGTAPQNSMNVGQGTVPQNQINSGPMTGQGVNPINSMMTGNPAVVNSTNRPLIGGTSPIPPNVGQGIMITTTIDPLSMETTTQEFINGYAQMCNPVFSVVINRPTVCGANDTCPIGYICAGNYCCPTKSTVCSPNYDSGKEPKDKEFTRVGRYAFNPSTQQCFKFSYFGTEGNFNNFRSYNDCMQYCASSN